MPTPDPGDLDPRDNDFAINKVNGQLVDGAVLNQFIDDLIQGNNDALDYVRGVLRADGTLADEVVKNINLHPEVLNFIQTEAGIPDTTFVTDIIDAWLKTLDPRSPVDGADELLIRPAGGNWKRVQLADLAVFICNTC